MVMCKIEAYNILWLSFDSEGFSSSPASYGHIVFVGLKSLISGSGESEVFKDCSYVLSSKSLKCSALAI